MSTVTINQTQQYDATPERVWAIVGDFYALHTWVPAVTATRADTSTRTRYAVLPDGGEMTEQLIEEGERCQRYRVLAGPMPLREFVAQLQVRDAEGGSEIVWQATFEPVGLPAAEAQELVTGVFRGGLENLSAMLDNRHGRARHDVRS